MSKEKEKKAASNLPAISEKKDAISIKDPLQQYLSEVSRYPLLSREEEDELIKRFMDEDDKAAAQKLVVSNLRLVVKIAMEYGRAMHNAMDLIQEGNMGLIRALTKYDATKGTRFSYYASWWIRAYILKFIIDNYRLVKVGTTQAQKKLFYNLMKEKRKMEAMGFTPKTKLLSTKLNVKEKDVVEMEQRMSRSDMSLDAPSKVGENKVNFDFFSSEDDSPETQVESEDLKNKLFENLSDFVGGLKEKEKKIFSERLYAEVPKTLQEIANDYGITRERIRQIEARLIEKLKDYFKEKGFDINIDKKESE